MADAAIAAVQGSGAASPFVGQTVRTRGVVTASYPSGGLAGYVIQTPGSGGALDVFTHVASDAIFVSAPAGAEQPIGVYVEVVGVVGESGGTPGGTDGRTQISASDVTVLSEAFVTPSPATLRWPVTEEHRESLESMLFLPTGRFTVTDTSITERYGEVGLASGGVPLKVPTDYSRPGYETDFYIADNAARAITLDDASSVDFLSDSGRDLVPAYLSLVEPVRVGAAVTFAAPLILDQRDAIWKLTPTSPVIGDASGTDGVVFQNTRKSVPNPVGGDFSIATFPLPNYFTTLRASSPGCREDDQRAGDGVTPTGPLAPDAVCNAGGAWDAADLQRQQDKIVAALTAMDADVVGLTGMENSARLGEQTDEATATLVAALNAAAGSTRWAFVPSSTELPDLSLQDMTSNAIIYQPAAVERIGQSRALGTMSADGELFSNAREPLAQVFRPAGGGKPLLFVATHLTARNVPGPLPQDPDRGDGQETGTGTRMEQARALMDWTAGFRGDIESVALAGNFNSFSGENPLRVLSMSGWQGSIISSGTQLPGTSINGRSGSLIHIVMNPAGWTRGTGERIWNISSGESPALAYDHYDAHNGLFYRPDPFRSSEHDPVIVGLRAGTENSRTELALAESSFVSGMDRGVEATATVTIEIGEGGQGSVEFTVDGSVVATAASVDGLATAQLTLPGGLGVGDHEVRARYLGEETVHPSVSPPATITVRPPSTTTTLVAAPPLHINRFLRSTLVASVVVENGDAPIGSIEFREGEVFVGTSIIGTNGTATMRLPGTLTRGTHRYTATYVPADPSGTSGSSSFRVRVLVLS